MLGIFIIADLANEFTQRLAEKAEPVDVELAYC
jgi:hypothetical protein